MIGILDKKKVEESPNNSYVHGYVVFQSVEEKSTRDGRSSYLSGNVQCVGSLPYKVWSNSSCFPTLKANSDAYLGSVCEIEAKVNVYEGQVSIIIDSIRVADGEDGVPDVSEFYESRYDSNKYLGMLKSTVQKNCSSAAYEVFEEVLSGYEKEFKSEFAAINHHDNCWSGLIGHTVKLVKMASMLQMYPELVKRCGGRDVLYVGLALHDIGKVIEYNNGSISWEGKHLSHMVIGAMILCEMQNMITEKMGAEFFYTLVSIVSQHSGEYGDRPRTVAAYVAHLLDDLEARLTTLDSMSGSAQILYDGCKLN